jgi:phosphoglycerol transferase MdoB-like AlkP superfamily enzyme
MQQTIIEDICIAGFVCLLIMVVYALWYEERLRWFIFVAKLLPIIFAAAVVVCMFIDVPQRPAKIVAPKFIYVKYVNNNFEKAGNWPVIAVISSSS